MYLMSKNLHHNLRGSKEAFFLLGLICVSGQLLCLEEAIWAKGGGKVSPRGRGRESQQKFDNFKASLLLVKNFQKKPIGNMCIAKWIFSDQIKFMMHNPRNVDFGFTGWVLGGQIYQPAVLIRLRKFYNDWWTSVNFDIKLKFMCWVLVSFRWFDYSSIRM